MNLNKYRYYMLFFIALFLCFFLCSCDDNKDEIDTGISSVDELDSIILSKSNMSELFDAADDDSERSEPGSLSVSEDQKEPDFTSVGESSESSDSMDDNFTNVPVISEDFSSVVGEQPDPAVMDNTADMASSENDILSQDDELSSIETDGTVADQSSAADVGTVDKTADSNISSSEKEIYEVKDSNNNISDGKSINDESEDRKNASIVGANDDNSTTYVLNTNTKKFHYSDCGSVKQMKAKNKKTAQGRASIISSGYEPCKRCNP